MIALLLACATESHPSVEDRARYMASISAPPEQARGLCLQIGDAGLRADCQVHTAAHIARTDAAAAQAICEDIPEEIWREECWFLSTDNAQLTGEDALAACERAGRFANHCRGHTLGREVIGVAVPVGEEAEGVEGIARLVRRYRPRSKQLQLKRMANELLAGRVGERWKAEPFDPSLCGVLSRELCAWAYTASLSEAQGELGGACQDGVATALSVQDIGLPGWTPAGEPIAQQTWKMVCDHASSEQPIPLQPPRMPKSLLEID